MPKLFPSKVLNKAALKFVKKTMRRDDRSEVIITGGLGFYGAAMRENRILSEFQFDPQANSG